MTAPAHIAEPPPNPDPSQDLVTCHITYRIIDQALRQQPDPATDPRAPAIAPAPTRILRLLGVLRVLITFGTHLAATLKANPCSATVRTIGTRFGAFNTAVILARITRALQLAQALEAKLAPHADRPDPAPRTAAPFRTSSPQRPRQPRRPVTPQPTLPQDDAGAILAALPTAEELAQQLRTRPVHAVLIDICNDLGICPSDPLWNDIDRVLMDYNGSFLRLWKDQQKRFQAALHKLIPPNVRFVWPTPPSFSDLALAHAERAAARAATRPP